MSFTSGRRRRRNSTGTTTTVPLTIVSTTNPPRKLASKNQPKILHHLSEICRCHHTSCHQQTYDSIPDCCIKAIDSLARLVPKLEEQCDVRCIGEFYWTALNGDFCPYAAQILEANLPDRIHFLLNHLEVSVVAVLARVLNLGPPKLDELVVFTKDLLLAKLAGLSNVQISFMGRTITVSSDVPNYYKLTLQLLLEYLKLWTGQPDRRTRQFPTLMSMVRHEFRESNFVMVQALLEVLVKIATRPDQVSLLQNVLCQVVPTMGCVEVMDEFWTAHHADGTIDPDLCWISVCQALLRSNHAPKVVLRLLYKLSSQTDTLLLPSNVVGKLFELFGTANADRAALLLSKYIDGLSPLVQQEQTKNDNNKRSGQNDVGPRKRRVRTPPNVSMEWSDFCQSVGTISQVQTLPEAYQLYSYLLLSNDYSCLSKFMNLENNIEELTIAIVKCGVYVDMGGEDKGTEASAFLEFAKAQFWNLCGGTVYPDLVPDAVVETLECHAPLRRFVLFGGIPCCRHNETVHVASKVYMGPLLTPVAADHALQARRLGFLSACLGLSSTGSLEEQTLDALSSAGQNHAEPLVRLCVWQSVAWLFLAGVPPNLSALEYLVQVAIQDVDATLRAYCCNEMTIVLSSRDFRSLRKCLGKTSDDGTVTAFFKIVDKVAHDAKSDPDGSDEQPDSKSVSTTQSLSKLWGSLLKARPCTTSCGKVLFQNALARLVRNWATLSSSLRNLMNFSQMCQGALFWRGVSSVDRVDTLAPVLFRELLADDCAPDSQCNKEELERRFEMLSIALQTLLGPEDVGLVSRNASDAERLLESCLPIVITQFIIDKDYHSLKLTTAFKLYILGKKREEQINSLRENTNEVLSGQLFGRAEAGCLGLTERKSAPAVEWRRKLPEKLRMLCTAPPIVEQIVPLICSRVEEPELRFFIDTVLRGSISLGKVISARHGLILKNFAVELGRRPDHAMSVLRGLRLAALARARDDDAKTLFEDCVLNVKGKVEVVEWVTSQFLYLLFNVIQQRWGTKTQVQRVESFRTLSLILQFLRASEAYQFFPQVMASVNAALVDSPLDKGSHGATLKLLAVEVLSEYLKLVAKTHTKILGENLTSVVVALVPIFSDVVDDDVSSVKCQTVAVSILEWLAEGRLGQNLASSFAKIPFIPLSPALETFRSSLRAIGINFDNLRVAPSQQDVQLRSSTSDAASVDADTPGAAVTAAQQTALKRRLETICSLLENENTSTRRVVLEHLASLLRANREIFHGLVESEGAVSTKSCITVQKRGRGGFARGTITEIMDVLLSRCVQETDVEARILLATCIGEVGAIGVHRMEGLRGSSEGMEFYKKLCPPWHSTAHAHGLRLVTDHLCTALKTATSTNDQNKIAYSIQQLLTLLNEAAKGGLIESPTLASKRPVKRGSSGGVSSTKPSMVQPLVDTLVFCGVADVVEPFWYSEYNEPGNASPKSPPYFSSSSSYYAWLSSWSRYLVFRAYENTKNEWTGMLHACRTAMRTVAGIDISEFLLPLLLIDCLCFGNGRDFSVAVSEIQGILSLATESDCDNMPMPPADRRKAVNTVLLVLSLLQGWSQPEFEDVYRRRSRKLGDNQSRDLLQNPPSTRYDWHGCCMRISDLQGKISMSLRAKASAAVGMHAGALRYFEMASRLSVSQVVFGGSSTTYSHPLPNRSRAAGTVPVDAADSMKDVLAALGDSETLSSLMTVDSSVPQTRVKDSIRLKESLGDWHGALHDYEWAQQIAGSDLELRQGSLRCLLEQGHFETVLQLIDQSDSASIESHLALGVEASWRLGQWDTLSRLTDASSLVASDPETAHQLNLGKSVLSLHRKDFSGAMAGIQKAREAVMDGLSSAALESYGRAYNHIVRLQAIREIEDVAELLCSHEATSFGQFVRDPAISWDYRFHLVSSSGANFVTNTRLALARLGGDHEFEAELMLLNSKRARKSGLYDIASNACDQAEACLDAVDIGISARLKFDVLLEGAKIKHDGGTSGLALRMLGKENLEVMMTMKDRELFQAAKRQTLQVLGLSEGRMPEKECMDIFVRSALKSTRWMIEGGLKGSSEIMARFQIINRIAPRFEKGHFAFAKYINSVLESRINALQGNNADQSIRVDNAHRGLTISHDATCQHYVLLAIEHYAETLQCDVKLHKYVYQALPRLLSLWFDFTAIKTDDSALKTRSRIKEIDPYSLSKNQVKANELVAGCYRQIPAQAFYTAMAQLISRINHPHNDTANITQRILKRILIKYPAQALWPLAWICHSQDVRRQQIGNEIFDAVERQFLDKEKWRKFLPHAKILLDYLYCLATKEAPKNCRSIKVAPISRDVELSDFVPPIQAALSASLANGDSGRTRDAFPRFIPRMRAIENKVVVMASKAKPKKLTVYVVPADPSLRPQQSNAEQRNFKRGDYDIGELHFLLKQEAKGDLRKDARVQDLNNVVNRLMAEYNESKGLGPQQRRLHLRTFTVTCLSESTGLLEWVPSTGSMRSLLERTHNPQATEQEEKRRGKRITNFGEQKLHRKYQECQNMYFKEGNLTKAAAKFEDSILKSYPPVFYWWFVRQYPDPHRWYEARTRFTLSTAAWSAVGHVIGLGDRHTENILLDGGTGECVHVDFDCIFDKGLSLPKPEVVPFRLTQNMVDAFGPTGTDGMYASNLRGAMDTLRKNRDTLLSVLEPFVKDPVITWKRSSSSQKSTRKDPISEAKRDVRVIDERLRGIYNLRNPNHRKVPRTDITNDELSHHALPLSVEGQVQKMIAEATSGENLVQLYYGWMSWA